jgi:hypothetical protein
VFKNFKKSVPFFFETASKVGLDIMLQEFLASESQNKAQKRNIVAGIRLNTTKGPKLYARKWIPDQKARKSGQIVPAPQQFVECAPLCGIIVLF